VRLREYRELVISVLTVIIIQQDGKASEYGFAANAIQGSQVRRLLCEGFRMVLYKCFVCDKEIEDTSLRKRVRCMYCGSKLLFKPRTTTTIVKAR